MSRYGSPHGEGFLLMALASLRLAEGRLPELEPVLRARADRDAQAADALAVVLAGTGRADEARAVRGTPPPIPGNYFRTFFLTLRALAVLALADRAEAAVLHEALLPYRDRVPGAVSSSVVLPPVAHTLGLLSRLLGRPAEAASHFSLALRISRVWGGPHWEQAVLADLARLDETDRTAP
jgi:hypothetical protein